MDTDDADAPDTADLVAELDDEPPDDAADDGPDEAAGAVYRGPVHGGPWDGLTAASRYPKGFLLVDAERGWLWIYDYQPDDSFTVRDATPEPVISDENAPLNRWRAADEENYDILVPDVEFGSDDES